MTEHRNSRQEAILPTAKLLENPCTVIGVGAIGRQVALQLAAIGVPQLQLIDFDTVEVVNLGPQGYFQSDIGKPKVVATGALCTRINPEVKLEVLNDPYKADTKVHPAVFCCVDKMEARKFIYESLPKHPFFIDGRMSAEVIRLISATSDDWERYLATLFTEGEAFTGSCTAKSTIFTANIAAGLMVQQYSKWLRGMPLDQDTMFNLLSMEVIDMTTQQRAA